MTGEIRVCSSWDDRHDRPRYTLGETCPECAGSTKPAAPARFSPEDPYGRYRRALLQRVEDEDE